MLCMCYWSNVLVGSQLVCQLSFIRLYEDLNIFYNSQPSGLPERKLCHTIFGNRNESMDDHSCFEYTYCELVVHLKWFSRSFILYGFLIGNKKVQVNLVTYYVYTKSRKFSLISQGIAKEYLLYYSVLKNSL